MDGGTLPITTHAAVLVLVQFRHDDSLAIDIPHGGEYRLRAGTTVDETLWCQT